jgi:hypothetical protein
MLPLPVVNVIPSGSASFCSSDSLKLQAYPASNYSFQWELNGANIPGAINNKYFVHAGGAGSYKVHVSDGICSFSLPSSITVSEKPAPVVNISFSGGVFYSSGFFPIYQWYINNIIILNEKGSTMGYFSPGTFHLVVTDSTGCKGWSNVLVLTDVEGITELENKLDIYPSPIRSSFVFNSTEKGTLTILDLQGRKIKTYDAKKEANQLAMPPQIASGTYLAIFHSEDGRQVLKRRIEYLP